MSCVTVKSRIINVDSTVRLVYVGLRSGIDCNCDVPGFGSGAVTMQIRRAGQTEGTLITYPAFNRDAMGNIGFYLDTLLYNSPNGLYTATVFRGSIACIPALTFRIGKPCNIDGAYVIRSVPVLGDENPSP